MLAMPDRPTLHVIDGVVDRGFRSCRGPILEGRLAARGGKAEESIEELVEPHKDPLLLLAMTTVDVEPRDWRKDPCDRCPSNLNDALAERPINEGARLLRAKTLFSNDAIE